MFEIPKYIPELSVNPSSHQNYRNLFSRKFNERCYFFVLIPCDVTFTCFYSNFHVYKGENDKDKMIMINDKGSRNVVF